MRGKSVARMVLCFVAVCTLMFDSAKAQPDVPIEDIFDNDSEFMRGFETGLFLRTKGGTVEEYGCTVKAERSSSTKAAFDMIKSNIDVARQALDMDPIIDNALNIVVDILDSVSYFQTLLSKKGMKQLDQYCTGMVFGLHGSQLLVKMANTLINPVGPDGEVKNNLGKKKQMPKIEVPKPKEVKGMFANLAEGLMNTAMNAVNSGRYNDEL